METRAEPQGPITYNRTCNSRYELATNVLGFGALSYFHVTGAHGDMAILPPASGAPQAIAAAAWANPAGR
jgi:hypothetical protein